MTPPMLAMTGMSRQLVGSETCTEATAALGTIPYIAPEVFDSGTPTQASDAYAFGILCESRRHALGTLRLLLVIGTLCMGQICFSSSLCTRTISVLEYSLEAGLHCSAGFSLWDALCATWHAVWEMWHGTRAHEGLLEAQIAAAVCCGGVRPDWDDTVPPQLAALASDCWAQHPADR